MMNNKRPLLFSLVVILALAVALNFYLRQDREVDQDQLSGAPTEIKRQESTPRVPAALAATTKRVEHLKRYGARFRGQPRRLPLDFDLTTEIQLRKPFEISLRYRSAPATRYLPEMGERVVSINGFVIYRPLTSPFSAEEAIRFEANSFPVLRDTNNGMVGLLSGRAIVKLKNADFDIAGLLGGEKIYEATHLGVSYIKLSEGTDLVQAFAQMQDHEEIERGDLEILQGGVVTK